MSPSATSHTGAMIALVPSDADLDRLALADGEPRDELHLTLWFLGQAATYDASARAAFVDSIRELVDRREATTFAARAFGVAHWNPASDDPAWVLNVGDVAGSTDETLSWYRSTVGDALVETGLKSLVPDQHSPWQPHVCLAYSSDDLLAKLETRLGDLTFDRVRVAFGDEVTDVELAQPATVASVSGGDAVPWHVARGHGCSGGKPWAVVKDATGEVEGCHATEADANDQLAALYANENAGGETVTNEVETPCVECGDDVAHFGSGGDVSNGSWDGSPARFTDPEYRRSAAGCDPGSEPPKSRCFLPHHEPGGALSRAGLHAAAARFNQLKGHNAEAVARAKSHLRSHYNAIGEPVPDVLQAEVADVISASLAPTITTRLQPATAVATTANASTFTLTTGQTLADQQKCPQGQHRMPDGSCMSDQEMYAASTWEGVLCVEGTPTGDGREFAVDALSWVEGALLRWQKEGAHGGEHDVTVAVGRIDRVWRDGNKIMGAGVIDLLNPDGFELRRRMKGGFAGGISIDADDIQDADVEFIWADDDDSEVELDDGDVIRMLFGRPEKMIYHGGRVRAATVVDIPAFVEAHIVLTDGVVSDVAPTNSDRAFATHATETSDAPWSVALVRSAAASADARDAYAWSDGGDAYRFLHHEVDEAGVGAANVTACAAAIAELNVRRALGDVDPAERRLVYAHLASHLRDAGQEPPPLVDVEPLVAAATAVAADEWRPPAAWFGNPQLTVPIGITVTDQGRVYGHVAQWGTCHIGFDSECVTPPYETEHPYFMTGEVTCADGSRVAVGQITVGTGHAPLGYRASRAAEHYDDTGVAVADVVVGNDDVGIWVAGAVRPAVEAARVHELRASGQVSGDWRRIGGALRLVGLLAVNVPGFPVPRLRARVASGVPQALVAAGHTAVVAPVTPRMPSDDELDKLAMRRVMDILVARVERAHVTEGVS